MPSTDAPAWMQRNLKWLILAGVLLCLLFLVALLGIIAFTVVTATRSSDVYRTAMSRAQAHPTVIERLGTPVEPGLLVQGRIEVDARRGEADLSIPIHGPRGEAEISLVATKRGGVWRYQQLEVRFADGAPVELRNAEDRLPRTASPDAASEDESTP